MEEFITLKELLYLLSILWLPIFALAAVAQWRLLTSYRARLLLPMSAAFVAEIVLAFAAWLSPLHPYFPSLDSPPILAIGSIPLFAGIISVVSVTTAIWATLYLKHRVAA